MCSCLQYKVSVQNDATFSLSLSTPGTSCLSPPDPALLPTRTHWKLPADQEPEESAHHPQPEAFRQNKAGRDFRAYIRWSDPARGGAKGSCLSPCPGARPLPLRLFCLGCWPLSRMVRTFPRVVSIHALGGKFVIDCDRMAQVPKT